MIDVLLVDDDATKIQTIGSLLQEILVADEARLVVAPNAYEAGQLLRKNTYDLLILDINVPMRSGEAPDPEGGLHLLRAIHRRPEFHKPHHIVGLTAYADLASRHANDFRNYMWFLIRYDNQSREWEEQLGRKLVHIASAKNAGESSYRTDLAIVTALHRVELEAVLALEADWSLKRVAGDDTIYHEGRLQRGGRTIRTVAAAANEMGMPAAVALCMKVIQTFTPRYIAMVGIAAGVGGQFGDLLIADQSWDYGSGKLVERPGLASEFRPSPEPILLDPSLKSRLNLFALNSDVRQQIYGNWSGRTVSGPPDIRIGPLASGASVLSSRERVAELVGRNRKLVGVEMEIYGVFVAARSSKAPRPAALAIKSICDFGDDDKTDDYQEYAAYTSATFLREFALEWLESS